jgi:molybdenum cofactor biosynthesis protein A
MPYPIERPGRAVLTDPSGRHLDYLRLAVTDRCNLRCRYCMPAAGIDLFPRDEMLSFEEAERLVGIFVALGMKKLRITGGEPLARRGTPAFMARIASAHPALEVLLTTNGLLLRRHLSELVAAGVSRVNLSLDSLDPRIWSRVTRRQGHAEVMAAIDAVRRAGLGLKVNVVVISGVNDHELAAFVALTRHEPLEVRFIEAMTFDGAGRIQAARLPAARITERLADLHPLVALPARPTEVARRYRIPGHVGTVGVIAGHERVFCGTCNRLRLDARGRLRTCLYGGAGPDLKALLRGGGTDEELAAAIRRALAGRHVDGLAAGAAATGGESMASIGG